MKRRFAQEQKRDLVRALQALQNVIQQNEQKKTFTVEGLIQKLIIAFCDQTTATWQYFTAIHTARGQGRLDALPEYEQHMEQQAQHLQKIAHRIQQLGGKVVFDLNQISALGHNWERVTTSKVEQQLKLLINAQRDARQFYQSIIYHANALQDWVTSNLFKQIIQDQTKHQFDLKRVLEELD